MTRSVTFALANGTHKISGATIVFEPSTFDGSPGTRKNIVLSLDEETETKIREWEAAIDPDKLSSAITNYGLRCKICIDTARVWDGTTIAEMPETLKGKTANILLTLSGIWTTKKQSGLSLSVTDMEFCECTAESPFV